MSERRPTCRDYNYPQALATLGERWQDTGNGALRVVTHAGLVVSLTVRERHPPEAAQRLLIEINDLRRVGRGLPAMRRSHAETPSARARYNAQQALLRRKLIERATGGVLRLLRVTKAGRVAAARFRVMLLTAKKRELRAAAAKKKAG